MEKIEIKIDADVYARLNALANSLGFANVDDLLARIGDGKNFVKGCAQPAVADFHGLRSVG